jgi:glutathione S-transferase
MQLYVSPRAPNPRRVQMFLAEKGVDPVAQGIALVNVDLNAQEHKTEAFRAKSPLARLPALALDDGRVLTETRAICTYLEGRFPEPNLMGVDATERAFVEMADRRIEWYFMLPIGNCIRHTHPGLAPLEQPQFPEFGRSQGDKLRDTAVWLDGELQLQPWIAGDRFSIADITAFCAIEFARLMKFNAGEQGLHGLQAWRDRMAQRPSALV